jgi:hypothetical protein
LLIVRGGSSVVAASASEAGSGSFIAAIFASYRCRCTDRAPYPDRDDDGRCFTVPPATDAAVAAYAALGVPTTAILYGTPGWARGERPCTPVSPGFVVFCVPDHPEDYARFVAMVAQRYDGAQGHGRVTDFVIQNEVNSNDWFDIGCGQGTACDLQQWLATYADLYNAAYDRVVAHQPQARVLISLTQHLRPVFDHPAATRPLVSVETFVVGLAPRLSARQWSIAIHPYPRNVFVPQIGALDLPYVTLGNIGVLPGWLRATFPDRPRAWEVQITEVGLNNDGTQDALQAASLCTAFRNVLATPGVTSFIYHRLIDFPDEGGLALGLRHQDGTPKPAFAVWHDANDPGHPTCGFEHAGRTLVRHATNPADGAGRYSSREMPATYVVDGDPTHQWWFDRSEGPGRTMVFECGGPRVSYLTTRADCGGDLPFGPVGSLASAPAPGRTELYVCATVEGRVVTTQPACPFGDRELLGYVDVAPTPAPVDTTPPTVPVPTAGAAQPVGAAPSFTG